MPQWASLILLISLLAISCSKSGVEIKSAAEGPSDESTFQSPGDGTAGVEGVDPLAFEAWHLRNIKQRTFSDPGANLTYSTYGQDSGRADSHSLFNKGEGVRVGISDNGTEIMHEDLYFNIDQTAMRDYSSDDPNDWLGDPAPSSSGSVPGHGTAVTGIIGALKNNSRGSYGIAPEATLIPFKFVGTSGSNYFAKEIDQASGLIDVFNYSYGRNSCSYRYLNPDYIDQLRYGVTHQRGGKGSLYVKAAGNEYWSYLDDCSDGDSSNDSDSYFGNANMEEDNSYPYVIVVGGLNANGISASYSTPGSSLWVSAPAGEDGGDLPAILTTDLMGCKKGFSHSKASKNSFENGDAIFNPNCNYTSTMNGTSSAAPMVTGAIALILAQRPELSWRDVKDILARSARVVQPGLGPTGHPASYGGSSEFDSPAGHTYLDGWGPPNDAGFRFHNWYGFGALDIKRALELAQARTQTFPQLYETIQNGDWKYLKTSSQSVPDNSAQGVSSTLEVSDNLITEAVQVRLSVTHTRASDLGVELTSPSGTKSQLMLINSNILDKSLNDVILLSNAFYGENAQGVWTLKVLDGKATQTGTLTRWGINIFGHAASAAPVSLSEVGKSESLRTKLSQIYPVSVLYEENIKSVASVSSLSGDKKWREKAAPSRSPAINKRVASFTFSQVSHSLENKQKKLQKREAEDSRACLLTNRSELLLRYRQREASLLGSESALTLFALNKESERIVVMIKDLDSPLAKVNVYDFDLKLIDENFIDEIALDHSLSSGLYKGERVFFLSAGGLNELNLQTLSVTQINQLSELKGLSLYESQLVAESAQEIFKFDSKGTILERNSRPISFKRMTPEWQGKKQRELCVDTKEKISE